MNRYFILAATALLAVAGCKDKHNPVKAAKQAGQERDLQNTFQSECQLKPVDLVITGLFTGGKAVVKSARTLYRFEGNRVTRTTQFFAATNCSAEAGAFIETGVFEINKDIKTNDGGKGIDLKFDKVALKIASPEGAQIANSIKMCDRSDWSAGQEKVVTPQSENTSCYGAKVPRTDANVYRVDNGNLILGSSLKTDRDASSRPSKLDFGTKYAGK
ncbi:MAG: hypothetical protein AB7F86_04610 [Bdellovibrionales bacterium]